MITVFARLVCGMANFFATLALLRSSKRRTTDQAHFSYGAMPIGNGVAQPPVKNFGECEWIAAGQESIHAIPKCGRWQTYPYNERKT